MNTYLVVAAGLSALGGVLHSILGERLILSKLAAAKLPETLGSSVFTLRVLRLFWHLVSVAWWGLAALLALLASMPASAGCQPSLSRSLSQQWCHSSYREESTSRGVCS